VNVIFCARVDWSSADRAGHCLRGVLWQCVGLRGIHCGGRSSVVAGAGAVVLLGVGAGVRGRRVNLQVRLKIRVPILGPRSAPGAVAVASRPRSPSFGHGVRVVTRLRHGHAGSAAVAAVAAGSACLLVCHSFAGLQVSPCNDDSVPETVPGCNSNVTCHTHTHTHIHTPVDTRHLREKNTSPCPKQTLEAPFGTYCLV
jgi:hypothetical protein